MSLPMIAAYAVLVAGKLFRGSMITTILDSVKILIVVTIFIITLFNAPITIPGVVVATGYWLLASAAVFAAYKILFSYSKKLSAFAFFAFFIVFSFVIENMAIGFFLPYDMPPLLGNIIFCSFLVPAALSLLSLLEMAGNDYLSYIGKRLKSLNLLMAIAAIALFSSLYLGYIRSIIIQQFSIYLILAEWGVICLASYAIYRDARRHVLRYSQELVMGDWALLTQKVTVRKDQLEDVSSFVSDFIDSGKKEPLLMFISKMMLSNNVNLDWSYNAISPLVRYRDLDLPKLAFAWRTRGIQRENKRNRIQVTREAMDAMRQIFNNVYGVQNTLVTPDTIEDKTQIRCIRCGREYPGRFPDCPYCYAGGNPILQPNARE